MTRTPAAVQIHHLKSPPAHPRSSKKDGVVLMLMMDFSSRDSRCPSPNLNRHHGHVGTELIFIEEPLSDGVMLEGLLLWRMKPGHQDSTSTESFVHQCRRVARFIRPTRCCHLMNSRFQSICHSRVNVQLMSLFHGGLSPAHA